MSTKTLMTVEQFVQLPPDERVRFELSEGELIPVSSGTPRHSLYRDELVTMFKLFLKQSGRGVVLSETDCRTIENSIRRPDVSFFTAERWQLVNSDEIPIPFPPDIAIEILSPSETAMAVNKKVLEYLNSGSREVWLLDSRNREVHVRDANGIRIPRTDDNLESPLLPGFSICIADVWRAAL